MKAADKATLTFDDWEANHAALIGRRNGPPAAEPRSGEYWAGPVKAQIESQPGGGYRWFLISGDGRFRLAQSPKVFESKQDCAQHLKGFSPTVQFVSNHQD